MQEFIDELIRLAKEPISVLRNPRVSALIVDKQNKVLASGVHLGQGTDHAELMALKKLSKDLSDCTLYVSLEPCNHYGTTGPCTNAIIESGIKKVVIGALDINPVSRGGLEKLKSAGIEVLVWGNQAPFIDLNFRWFQSIKLLRPYVVLKAAVTLDGFIAKSRGVRTQITSGESLVEAHRLRSEFDAILVGTNTVEVDDPHLTVRLEGVQIGQQPLRVVMGTRELSDSLNIFSSISKTVQVKTHDPQQVLRELAAQKINTLMLEGGAEIYSSFLEADLVDEFALFMSSKIFGDGVSVIELLSDKLPASRLKIKSVIPLGPDLLIRAQNFRG
jgi:diaminohydroxyphosphoribosylaminopyrimidine deaminase / 5-amino-6-(5-phosphoribosylamino)uracil reductase